MIYGKKQLFTTSLTDTGVTDLEGLGTLRWEGNKLYKWVQYTTGKNNLPAVVGQVPTYWDKSLTERDGYKNSIVSNDRENNDITLYNRYQNTLNMIAAGVMISVPNNMEYCWIQLSGYAELSLTFRGSPLLPNPRPQFGQAVTAHKGKDTEPGGAFIGGSLCTMPMTTYTSESIAGYALETDLSKVNSMICAFPM